MPTVVALPSASAISDTDLLWLTRGLGSGRDQKLAMSLLKTYASQDAVTAIAAEAITRAAADTALAGTVTAEATNRANADTAEATARANADNALSTAISGISEKEAYTLGYASNTLLAAVGADGGGLDHVEGSGTVTVARLGPKIYSLTVNAVVDACPYSAIPKRWRLAINTVSLGYAFARMLSAFVSAGSYSVPHIVQVGFTNALDATTTFIPCQLTIDTTGTQVINGPSTHVWWIDINPIATTTAGNFTNVQGRFSLSEILVAP